MYTMMQVCRELDMTYQTLKFYCNEGLVPKDVYKRQRQHQNRAQYGQKNTRRRLEFMFDEFR